MSGSNSTNSYLPQLMRRNTIGVRYIEGNRNEDHYEKIIEEILEIREDELYGLDDEVPGTKQIMIKVTNASKYNFICDNKLDKHFTVAPGHVIQVEDLSSYRVRVILDFVPFEITNESLTKLLENYGEVGRVDYIRKRYRNNKFSKAIQRRRVAYIRLNKPIPCSLYLNQTNTYVYVRHERQPTTCHQCGKIDHKIATCKIRFDYWVNKVDIDISDIDMDSDTDTDSEEDDDVNSIYEDSISEVAVDINDHHEDISGLPSDQENIAMQNEATNVSIDDHLVTSQATALLRCPICEFKCQCDQQLKLHMKNHSGEKLYKCSECKFQCGSEDELFDHIKQHTDASKNKDEFFSCSECDYKCKLKAELDLHMKSHTGESPVDIINKSFSDIIKAPTLKVTRRTVAAHGLSSSQPAGSNEDTNKKKSKKT